MWSVDKKMRAGERNRLSRGPKKKKRDDRSE